MALLARFLLAVACCAPAAAAAPPPVDMPRGSEPVLIGRVYHGGPQGTRPVGLFGLRLSSDRTVSEVVVPADGDVPEYTLELSCRLKGSGLQLGWSLVPAAGASVEGAAGERRLERGTLGHLPIANAGGTEIFASVEHDRASAFAHDRLVRHFRGPAAPAAPAAPIGPVASVPTPARPAAAPAPDPATPRPAAVPAAVPGADLLLSFRLEQEGRPAFAPRVRVRPGQEFGVRGGEAVAAGSGLFDGFELSGVARRSGSDCILDLSVQTGRRLGPEAEAVWLVDRYRAEVRIPLGGDPVVLSVFEDVPDLGGGTTRLHCSCS